MNPLVDRLPRRHPDIVLSSPPQTMRRQMARVVTPGIPPLGYRIDGNVKVFELIAQPIEVVITEQDSCQHGRVPTIPEDHERFQPRLRQAKTMLAWGYNGNGPGQTLEATEGDRVRIILGNELPEPTSIHWHGFELPFSQDGASGYHTFEPRRPVLPGKTEAYEFDLIRSGTPMYQTSFNVMQQEALGPGGAFVVHPRRREPNVDEYFVLVLQQWTFQPGNPNPDINSNVSLLYHSIHIHGYVCEIVGTSGGHISTGARWRDITVTIGAPGDT